MNRTETIAELVKLLVEFYQPERVYLFGSATRGDDGPDSDFDFCVVLPDDAPESLYRDRSIHSRFWNVRAAVDVVPIPSSDFDGRAEHVIALQLRLFVREGCFVTADELLRSEAAKWCRQAGKDRYVAQILKLLEPSRSLFHSQQAAEKALKAFLTLQQTAFRKTHDLNELGVQCVAIDPALEPLLREASNLTRYASAFRYPDAAYEPDEAEAGEALQSQAEFATRSAAT